MSMKKIMNLVLAAILICGATLFASCTNEDNPTDPAANLSEMIIGKWIETDINGQPAATNAKRVYTFVSTTKAYLSASLTMRPEYGACWSDQVEATVAIDGNKVILNVHHNEHKSAVHEFTVTVINESEFTAIRKLTITVDGSVVLNDESTIRFVKQTTDYRETVLGLWEGHVTNSEGSEFDDGETHRWEYKADGTYVYYVKDGDDWVPYEGNTLNEYFVDGNLLCTRWIDQGQEYREWWEINIDGDKMNWTALRENEDGTNFTATFEMKKVE